VNFDSLSKARAESELRTNDRLLANTHQKRNDERNFDSKDDKGNKWNKKVGHTTCELNSAQRHFNVISTPQVTHKIVIVKINIFNNLLALRYEVHENRCDLVIEGDNNLNFGNQNFFTSFPHFDQYYASWQPLHSISSFWYHLQCQFFCGSRNFMKPWYPFRRF